MKNNKQIRFSASIIIIAISLFYAGFYFGKSKIQLTTSKSTQPSQQNNQDLKIFWEAFDKVNQDYVGTVDRQKAFYGAAAGMVASLGDPFSVFLPPEESKNFLADLEGEFEGIGIEIAVKNGKLVVIAPLKDSPADKAGVKSQDVILKIDGVDSQTIGLEQAVSKIRGKQGSEVKLLVQHKDEDKPIELKIKREKIKIQSVQSEMKKVNDKNILYIRIIQFGKDTYGLMEKVAKQARQTKPDGIVLDVRSDPGGYLDAAVDVASLWIDGVVVKERNKQGIERELKSTKEQLLKDYKLVVLIDGGSASASEILAGAIQDNGKGKLVGEKTFGKGSVQSLEVLSDNSTLRITIAKWLTPKGREINGTGIEPDIKVENSKDSQEDLQLQKALELIVI